jgi:hypothetical protein
MLKGLPSGLKSSPLPEVTWASQPDIAGEEGGEIQSLAMVQEGWELCKLTLDMLNNPRAKHKAKFCTDLSRVFLELFKQQCYGVVFHSRSNAKEVHFIHYKFTYRMYTRTG